MYLLADLLYHLVDLTNGSEWQSYSLSSYWQMKCRIYPPHRSANGSELQFYSLRSSWHLKLADLTQSPLNVPVDLNGNFTLLAHIGRWSGSSTGRSTPPPCRSANEYEWQFDCVELILANGVSDLLADLPTPHEDLPMDQNSNFTVTAHICRWMWQILLADLPHTPCRSANWTEW